MVRSPLSSVVIRPLALVLLAFIASASVPLGEQSSALVRAGSTWRYLDDGSDQGTAWRAAAFNDAAWAIGPAQLGYGDGDEATVVSFGPNPSAKYITTYFRRAFSVSNPASFASLQLRVLRDDGAVVYLNGSEIFRTNMPPGAISSTTLASTTVAGADESTFFSADINPSLRVAGSRNERAEDIEWIQDSSEIA